MSLDSPKKPMTRPDHEDAFAHEQEGLHKGLGARQLQMIAIGSAIGTGLLCLRSFSPSAGSSAT